MSIYMKHSNTIAIEEMSKKIFARFMLSKRAEIATAKRIPRLVPTKRYANKIIQAIFFVLSLIPVNNKYANDILIPQ